MRYADIRFQPATTIPPALAPLARAIQGKTYETAKRIIVSKTGSVRPRERFDDSLADAVFLRLQRVAQVGVYSSEAVVKALGRGAERLSGDGLITLYRSAPPGVGIRPGDFCTDDRHEAGFYKHGGNRIQMRKVPRSDVIRVAGSSGGGQEFIYLPFGYQAPEPVVYFASFKDFYRAVASA